MCAVSWSAQHHEMQQNKSVMAQHCSHNSAKLILNLNIRCVCIIGIQLTISFWRVFPPQPHWDITEHLCLVCIVLTQVANSGDIDELPVCSTFDICALTLNFVSWWQYCSYRKIWIDFCGKAPLWYRWTFNVSNMSSILREWMTVAMLRNPKYLRSFANFCFNVKGEIEGHSPVKCITDLSRCKESVTWLKLQNMQKWARKQPQLKQTG